MKRFCNNCNKKLNKYEANWCLACNLKGKGMPLYTKRRIWQKVNEEIKKTTKKDKEKAEKQGFGGFAF